MAEPLWQWDELVAAVQGVADGAPSGPITGVAIDSRLLQGGDIFVALQDARDGHAFVGAALQAGAAAALVAQDYQRAGVQGALLRVPDPLRGLADIARVARQRSKAKIAAITGSVGKTGTKEALRLCLQRAGPTHASEKSFNNQWGVPLTLARMPRQTQFGVFEIGMNHPGEITPLVRLVRPHVAIVTTVEKVHLAQFADVEAIAEAKAEIFLGLVPGGTAVLPRDNDHFGLLRQRALAAGAKVVSFGSHATADVRLSKAELGPGGSLVTAQAGERSVSYRIAAPGQHYVNNSLAVVAALAVLGADAADCLPALGAVAAPTGRGARTRLAAPGGTMLLIDESYNANPASVRAALAAMATTPRQAFARRIAVLGDMLELGDAAPDLHRGLQEAVDGAGVDLVLACGPMMKLLLEDLAPSRRGAWAATSVALAPALLGAVRAGDVVMIKGSLGSHMAPLVAAMMERFQQVRPGG
jgi:UDP-N-acetylmuramoyl-tripeptide--D-alanyl-D-alanine ligase